MLYPCAPAIVAEPDSVLLPEEAGHAAARLEPPRSVPVVELAGATVTVVVGALGGMRSPATVYSPLLGADITLHGPARLPLDSAFEHGVLVTSGRAEVGGVTLEKGALLYLGPGRTDLVLNGDARVFLLGGGAFEEPLVMWWNFVGRTHEEIAAAREDWMAGRRFGSVSDFDGDPLPAPAMPTTRLKARTRTGERI